MPVLQTRKQVQRLIDHGHLIGICYVCIRCSESVLSPARVLLTPKHSLGQGKEDWPLSRLCAPKLPALGTCVSWKSPVCIKNMYTL